MPQNGLTSPALRPPYTEPPFFSLTLHRQNLKPAPRGQQVTQKVYKLVSREALSDDELAPYVARGTEKEGNDPLIPWIDRQPLPASVPTIDFLTMCWRILRLRPVCCMRMEARRWLLRRSLGVAWARTLLGR